MPATFCLYPGGVVKNSPTFQRLSLPTSSNSSYQLPCSRCGRTSASAFLSNAASRLTTPTASLIPAQRQRPGINARPALGCRPTACLIRSAWLSASTTPPKRLGHPPLSQVILHSPYRGAQKMWVMTSVSTWGSERKRDQLVPEGRPITRAASAAPPGLVVLPGSFPKKWKWSDRPPAQGAALVPMAHGATLAAGLETSSSKLHP
jgi:hypothetical protein